jgi:predicted DNA-binding transcriptional regulator AlpA
MPKSPLPNRTQYGSVRDVASLCRISTITVWRWAKAGRIPEPLKLGENTTRWNLDEVQAALDKAAAAAKAKAQAERAQEGGHE